MLALSLGPLVVAVVTDKVFGRPSAVGNSLACVDVLASGLAAYLLLTGAPRIQVELPGCLMPGAPLPLAGRAVRRASARVQMRRLFPDGKCFVDMEPRLDPAEIMFRYRQPSFV